MPDLSVNQGASVDIPTADESPFLTNPREMSEEVQKYFTNSTPLKKAFYMVFSGWREVGSNSNIEVSGVKIPQSANDIIIDYYSRICNESGTTYLYNATQPLISHLLTTSKLNPQEIYDLWRGKIHSLKWALVKSYYLAEYKLCLSCESRYPLEYLKCPKCKSLGGVIKSNPYDFKIYRLSDTLMFLLSLSGITRKGTDGFTLKEIAESFLTSTIVRSGGIPMSQKTGILDSVKSMFGGKK